MNTFPNRTRFCAPALFKHDVTIEGTLRYRHLKGMDCGLFTDLASLTAAYPTPAVGMYALVVNPGDGTTLSLYACRQLGEWTLLKSDAKLDLLDTSLYQRTLDIIDSLSDAGHTLSGFITLPALDELPAVPLTPSTGYLVGGRLYLYVGKGGDTADGRYQDCGPLRGATGAIGPKGQDGTDGAPGADGRDGVVLDASAVNIFHDIADVAGSSLDDDTSQLQAMIPTGRVVRQMVDAGQASAAAIADTRLDLVGGIRTETDINGRQTGNYTATNSYFLTATSSGWHQYNHSSTKSYTFALTGRGITRVEGRVKFNATPGGYATFCVLSFYKTEPWAPDEVPEGYVGLWPGGGWDAESADAVSIDFTGQTVVDRTSWYAIAPYDKVVGKSSAYRTFDITPPAAAEGMFICGYGASDITITLTRQTQVTGIATQVADLDTRVAALEGAAGEQATNPNDPTNSTPNDQDCLLLRRHIADNWPQYFTTPANPTSYSDMNYLDGRIKDVPQGKHFIFITDTHWKDNPAKRSNWIASYIQKRLGGCPVVFGGDAVNHAASKYLAARELSVYADEFFSAFGDNCLFVCGNHDANYAAVQGGGAPADMLIDDREIYARTVARLAHKVTFDQESIDALNALNYVDYEQTKPMTDDLRALGEAWLRLHYHYDDTRDRVRHIVFETGIGGQALRQLVGRYTSYIIPMQFAWFHRVLLSTPKDYDIVVHGHVWTTDADDSDARNMLILLYHFISKTSVGINMRADNTTGRDNDGTWVYPKQLPRALCGTKANRTFDFRASEHQGRVIVVCGHFHIDRLYQFQNTGTWQLQRLYPAPEGEYTIDGTGILCVAVNTDNAARCKAGTASADITNDGRTADPAGTTDEVCFDVITLTPDNQLVCTRIGWGEDRVAEIPL